MVGAMAVAVIFGLAFATVLTLVMVPTFYSIADGLKERMGWQKERAVSVQGVPMMVIEAPDAVGMEEKKTYEGNVAVWKRWWPTSWAVLDVERIRGAPTRATMRGTHEALLWTLAGLDSVRRRLPWR